MIDYAKLPTEQHHPKARNLKLMSTREIIALMNQDNLAAISAIDRQKAQIEKAIGQMTQTLSTGGRIYFIGAGTSGRLGVIEAAEMPPTFGTSPLLVRAIMAGGNIAVFRSQEGAEDNKEKARILIEKKLRAIDLLIGVAASGVTPFVQGGLAAARKKKAGTILITCNKQKILAQTASTVIALDVRPEIISGSTRLKAGTVTKMALNILTTVTMVRLGKVDGNRMVDLQPKSKKLVDRGIRLVQEISGLPRIKAAKYYQRANRNVKLAVNLAKKS